MLIIWTDGAMTTVPLNREAPAPAQGHEGGQQAPARQ
jgi:hypothetical protein